MGLLAILCSGIVSASNVVVEDARLWAAPDNTRVVFDISAPVEHSLFSLSKPNRIVLDLRKAQLKHGFDGPDYKKGLIKKIRTAQRNNKDLRVVLDLKADVRPKSFVLKPNQQYGHRLVIDLFEKPSQANQAVKTTQITRPVSVRDVVIAIDAGHGGEDPGAIGARGTKEKDVVLAIALRLAKLVNQAKGMKAILIRDGDYYVGLRQRINLAKQEKADMFISIHADAFRRKNAQGASVYALSQRGATNEAAKLLAERENAADFVGGVSLDDKDDLLASVLLDLSMNGTIEASLEFGSYVLKELNHVGKVHKPKVEQAGFAVLKSPNIPSILVETAFISNSVEERKLRSRAYQERIAQSLMQGIYNYFSKNSLPGTIMAGRTHIIARGDTLSEIAKRYDVSVKNLRATNELKHDRIRIGDVLKIPAVESDS